MFSPPAGSAVLFALVHGVSEHARTATAGKRRNEPPHYDATEPGPPTILSSKKRLTRGGLRAQDFFQVRRKRPVWVGVSMKTVFLLSALSIAIAAGCANAEAAHRHVWAHEAKSSNKPCAPTWSKELRQITAKVSGLPAFDQ